MAQLCRVCGRRPKDLPRHTCLTCALRKAPAAERAAASARRLAMVPEALRVKRTKRIVAQSPPGTSFCAACQSFRDVADFGKGATTCRDCAGARSHAAMVAKKYGLQGDNYETLLEAQDGRCAICRARPKSKRLAVDHDHKSGAVRGLLCSRCNHDLMGAAWDSLAIAVALWHYLNTPPASGAWMPPEKAPAIGVLDARARIASNASDPLPGLVTAHSGDRRTSPKSAAAAPHSGEAQTPRYLPVGSQAVPGKRGVWRYLVEDEAEAPF